MFKTISAGLLAVTVLTAPALASPYRSSEAPVVWNAHYSARALDANAHWRRHHRHHRWHFHHRHHRHHPHYHPHYGYRHYWR
jgi:hypothetical protein